MKVVIDTNILITGNLGPHSYARKILQAVIEKKIQAYISTKIKKEYQLKVRELIVDQKYLRLLDQYLQTCEMVQPTVSLAIIQEDQEDNKFLEVAQTVKADYLVTADNHLLSLDQYQQTQIVKPEIFLDKLNDYLDSTGQQRWLAWAKNLFRT